MAANDERPPVTRREFLEATSLVAAAASVTPGCTPRALVVRGACHHDCPDFLDARVEVERDRFSRLSRSAGSPP